MLSIPELNEALCTSLELAALATLISTVIGTAMAIALVRHKFHGRRAANLLIVIPMATPEVVIGASLLSMFVYSTVALGFTTLLIAHVMFCISFVVVVVRSRLIGFDRNLEEAAADLGATPLATFRTVTLPLLAPGVLAAALLAFALSIDDFVISNFNSGTTVTFPLYVYGVSLRGIPVQVNVLATMLFLVAVVAVALVLFQQRRAERMAAVRPEPAPALRRRSDGRRLERAEQCAGGGAPRLANYVGGEWRAVDGVEALDDVDPASGEVAALVPLSGAAEVRRRSRRRGRRSRAGARRRRSGGRGRCWPCARSCCGGARSWSSWSAPTWARRSPTPTARSAAGSSRSSRRRRSRTCSRARTWKGSRPASTSRWCASRSAWSPRSRPSTSRR